mmetsp:Transcript_701/g.1663  ORF Transcript_701/g.1663 Transcript_701/m.1663 type:complete len:201 (+) Transcript_701:483-1085(+)
MLPLTSRSDMPKTKGTSVSHRSSPSMSVGLIGTVAAKIRDIDQGIVKTPSKLVTVVRKTAKLTLPLACVTMVTPEDKVVGTTQKRAIPCNNVISTRPAPKCKIGHAVAGVTKSTSTIPKTRAFGWLASETESKQAPLITKITTTATCGRPHVPNLMPLAASPGSGQTRPKVMTVRSPKIKKFLRTNSLTAMSASPSPENE